VYKINTRTIKFGKTEMGLSHKSLHTIYKGAFPPHMPYRVPVWIKALEKEFNGKMYNRVQRLMTIKIAKAYRKTTNEALCTLTGLTQIVIQAEEETKILNMMRECSKNYTYICASNRMDKPCRHFHNNRKHRRKRDTNIYEWQQKRKRRRGWNRNIY